MRKITLFILALCLILSLAACGQSASEAPAFDLDQYKADINESRELINLAVRDLANIANFQMKYGGAIGKMDESAVEHGFEWFEAHGGTREDVDEKYQTIREQYKEIVVIDEEGNEAKEIREAYVDMFEAYSEVYDLVTTPSGTPADFTNDVIEELQTVIDANDSLSLFLD